jgi:hypothetical protein
MLRKLLLSVVALFLVASASAAELVAFAPENVVVITPKQAPVSIAALDGSTDAKKLYVSVTFRNETSGRLEGARMAMVVFDGDRNVIGAASHRVAGRAEAGQTFSTDFELPLARPAGAVWQIMAVPVEALIAGEAGWQVRPEAVKPVIDRMKSSGVQYALATGDDLIPRGERVQLPPYNCTLQECFENNEFCNDYCAINMDGARACAFCDRRRTGETCSTTCYCVSFSWGECGANPYQ